MVLLSNVNMNPHALKFSVAAVTFELLMMLLFGVMLRHLDDQTDEYQSDPSQLPLYQDVHMMLLLGFGFLMTFIKRYSFSAIGFNFLLTAMGFQWGLLCNTFFHSLFSADSVLSRHPIVTESLIKADFSAASVLITFGALLGKTSPLQMIVILFFELIFFAINESLGSVTMGALDMGGSMFVHAFGAYFGLAVCWMITTPQHLVAAKRLVKSSRSSDMSAMIGTLVLSFGWVSFNGALAEGLVRQRVVINTAISLAASTVAAFILSQSLRKGHKFSMVDVQNATLAGGVAIGTASNLYIHPWSAFLVGFLAGLLSVVGYVLLQPLLEAKLGLQDTCGVHNLHGMPGIMGGIVGILCAGTATHDFRRELLFLNRHQMSPQMLDLRSNSKQAGYQTLALLCTLFIAIISGLFTGFIARQKVFEPPVHAFDDEEFWDDVPSKTETDSDGCSKNVELPGSNNGTKLFV